MKTRSTIAGLACITMLAGLAGVPTAASAQPYAGPESGGGYQYDACQRERSNRGTGGALIGAGIGAVTGSNVASGGARTEGAVLGGLLGAIIGGKVGVNSAACQPGTYTQGYADPRDGYARDGYARDGYAQGGYGQGGYYGYEGGQGGYQQGSYDPRYGDDGYDDRYGDAYARPVSAAEPSADNCSLAESPIYLPDGRVQKRFVRVCRDSSGKYAVVD